MRDRIELNKKLVPYRIQIALGSNIYQLYFQYNRQGDYYTVALYDGEGELLCGDTKIVYGVELWNQEYRENFPPVVIVPLDESGNTNVASSKTISETVFLTVDDEEGEALE